jgi:hypothetical protein
MPISDKRFVFIIYKEQLQINKKREDTSIEK